MFYLLLFLRLLSCSLFGAYSGLILLDFLCFCELGGIVTSKLEEMVLCLVVSYVVVCAW